MRIGNRSVLTGVVRVGVGLTSGGVPPRRGRSTVIQQVREFLRRREQRTRVPENTHKITRYVLARLGPWKNVSCEPPRRTLSAIADTVVLWRQKALGMTLSCVVTR